MLARTLREIYCYLLDDGTIINGNAFVISSQIVIPATNILIGKKDNPCKITRMNANLPYGAKCMQGGTILS
jgi:hypothetical protein